MARKTITVTRGRPTGEAQLPSHIAHCPDCKVTAEHKFSAMAVGIVSKHGEQVHGWTGRINVREK